MNKSLLYSRILQFSIVFSFLLPFFFVGCQSGEKSNESAAAIDSTATDTLAIVPYDLLQEKHIEQALVAEKVDEQTIYKRAEENDSSFSQKISAKHQWLSTFLRPNEFVMSGAAAVLDVGSESVFINIFFAFLLFIICTFIKFIEQSAIRTQILHNTLALLFLCFYAPDLSFQRLWGFGVCFTLIVATIGFDIYRFVQQKKTLSSK